MGKGCRHLAQWLESGKPQYSRSPVGNWDRLYPHRSRNCRVLVYAQSRYGLRKDVVWTKIRVMLVIPIARPPAGVDSELRQIGEPLSDQMLVDALRDAAHQSPKRIEICRSRSLRDQIGVEELVMIDLIMGVVMDLVSHFILNNLQGLSVVFVPGSAWDFVVLDAAEFVVLDPKVGLEQLQRRWEAK